MERVARRKTAASRLRRVSWAGTILFFLGVVVISSGCGREATFYSDLPLTPASLPATWTPTTKPVIAPPVGWALFDSREVEIWLPDNFVGGDPEQDIPALIDQMRADGGHFAEAAEILESNPGSFILWMFDSAESKSEVLTNLTIVKEIVPAEITVEQYLEAAQSHFPDSYDVLAAGPVALESGFEAGRIVLETSYAGLAIKEIVYVLKLEDIVYGLTFATSVEEFDSRLPVFKQAAQTFHQR